MDKNVLQSIAGVEIYPIISLVIFGLFFLGLLVYVLLSSRQHIDAMSQLPLLDDEANFKSNLNHDVIC
ncbi:cbb3-type cytochrome oxidase subunit 3 [Hymenobacter armeniacus]|uniref:Cbb3-type cytochrome c oxidase subunit 3 n=1 Tax=Hymenobacter armeniacus TaxID=2771358 RepID=A0ABR8JUS2_9BACT|nr:cbb3-type cytochrome c oxidase subunit 3 [Hymenobacter armeniacus]MBD2722335.1 cbb3-type cytochrome c oxidase subunit 3 [Hymenobacter armeniacus]